MKTFGLTGGIGMGKSTAAQILQSRGVAVVDTDDLARKVVLPGEPALGEIAKIFGSDMLDELGQLRREALAQIVFANDQARAQLEAILHPRITALWRAQLQVWQAEGQRAAVVVIPLLFETQAETEFAAVICLACAQETQRERLASRGWSPEQINQRLAAQLPITEKMQRSHYVVWTEGPPATFVEQLARIIPEVRNAAVG